MSIEVRRGRAADLDAIARIQTSSSEASQWDASEYLRYDLFVAVCDSRVAGFAVARRLAEGESELLNLAVEPASRRLGIARRLVRELTSRYGGTLWLEVRESNNSARNLYKSMGFSEISERRNYYTDTYESAIVMNVHS